MGGEPHIDHDNVSFHGECFYVAACGVCRLNVSENMPIQSILHKCEQEREAGSQGIRSIAS